MIDSLRYDALPGEPPSRVIEKLDEVSYPEMESLESLCEEGTRMSNFHTTHLSSGPSAASLLTGKYPREHGLFGTQRNLDPRVESLIEFFSDQGYRTILFNGHGSYANNGLMGRFDENLMGPPERLIARIRELNREDKAVFAFYEPLDLRAPYLLSKFPPHEKYHDLAIAHANDLGEKIGKDRSFGRMGAHYRTSEWQVPFAGNRNLPVWHFMLNTMHRFFQSENVSLDNAVNTLGSYYMQTLELLNEYQFDTLQNFLLEDEVGRDTTLFLTSNSGDGPTVRNDETTFGERLKPIEDAARVPGLFCNVRELPNELDDVPLTSQVDIAPTLLDEFGINYDPLEFSGISLFQSEAITDRDSIFVESATIPPTPEERKEQELSHRPSVLTWSSLLTNRGYKLNRKGLPVTDEDFERPLDQFFRRILAKIMTKWLIDEEIDGRVEKFKDHDSLEARQELVRTLAANREDPLIELFDWREDPGESVNLLDADDDELFELALSLQEKLDERFEDPYEIEIPFDEAEVEQEEIRYLEPLDAVGYIE